MNLKNLTQQEIAGILKELGQPAFRAKQVYTWLHKGVRSYDEMTNLPKALRDQLSENYPIHAPKVVRSRNPRRTAPLSIFGSCLMATAWKRF